MAEYNIGKLIAGMGLDNQEFVRGIREAEERMRSSSARMEASLQRIGDRTQQLGRQMRTVGRQMSLALTLPLTAIGGAAFKMSMDFESSMSKIVGLVGVARDQVNEWSKDIINLAPQLGKAPKELADAMFFITSAGLRGKEAMEVLEMSAKASTAGLGETKVVADLVTSAINAYGIENLNAAKATDILVAAVREGKAEADALAGSMGRVLPIAAELGVSFDQVGAATAAMTRTGTDANTAATQLRAIMTSLLKPTQQAEEALQAMGTSSAELRRQMREEGLIQTLGTLRNLTREYGEEALATVMPNIRALVGVLDLMGENAEDNIKIFKSLTDATGALDNAFGAASETTQFQLNQALSEGRALLTTLGNQIAVSAIPVIQALSEQLRKVSEWWQGLNESTQQWIIRIGAALAVAGPFLLIAGQMTIAIGALIKAMRILIPLKIALAKGMAALNAAWLASPIGVFVVGVAALTAGLYALNRIQNRVSADQKISVDIQERVAEGVRKEAAEVRKLTGIIEDHNQPLFRRNEAIAKLQEIIPDYHGSLDKEGKLIKHNTTAIQNYIKQLENRIKANVFEDMLTEAHAKSMEMEMKLQEQRERAANARTRAERRRAERLADYYYSQWIEAEINIDKLNKKYADFSAGLVISNAGVIESGNDVVDIINNVTQAAKEAIDMFFVDWGSYGAGEGLFDGITKELGAVDQAWDDLQTSFQISDMLGEVFDDFNVLENKIRSTEWAIEDMIKKIAAGEIDPMFLQAFIDQWKELKEQIEDTGDTLERWQQTALDSASIFGNAMAKMISDSHRTAREIVGAMLRQVTALLIRDMIANIPFPANIAVAATAPFVAEGLFQVIGLKEGGVIPDGFAGDKYPAFLNSQEVVIPPKKLEIFLDELMRKVVDKVTVPETRIQAVAITTGTSSVGMFGMQKDIRIFGKLENESIMLSNEMAQDKKRLIE